MSQQSLTQYFSWNMQSQTRDSARRSSKRKARAARIGGDGDSDNDATPVPPTKKAKGKKAAASTAGDHGSIPSSSKIKAPKKRTQTREVLGLQTPRSTAADSPKVSPPKTRLQAKKDGSSLPTPETLPARTRKGKQRDIALPPKPPSLESSPLSEAEILPEISGESSSRTRPPVVQTKMTSRSPIEITSSSSGHLSSPPLRRPGAQRTIAIGEIIEITSSEDDDNPFLDKQTSPKAKAPAPSRRRSRSPQLRLGSFSGSLSPLTQSDSSSSVSQDGFKVPPIPPTVGQRLVSGDSVPDTSQAALPSRPRQPQHETGPIPSIPEDHIIPSETSVPGGSHITFSTPRTPRKATSQRRDASSPSRPQLSPMYFTAGERMVPPLVLTPNSQRFVPSSQSQELSPLTYSPRGNKSQNSQGSQSVIESSQWDEHELQMPLTPSKNKWLPSKQPGEDENSPPRRRTSPSPMRCSPTNSPSRKAAAPSHSQHSAAARAPAIDDDSQTQSDVASLHSSQLYTQPRRTTTSSLPAAAAVDDSQTQSDSMPSASQWKPEFTPSPRHRRAALPNHHQPSMTPSSKIPDSSQTIPETSPPRPPHGPAALFDEPEPASPTPSTSRLPTLPPSNAPISSASAPSRSGSEMPSVSPRQGAGPSRPSLHRASSVALDGMNEDEDEDEDMPMQSISQRMPRDGGDQSLIGDPNTQGSEVSSAPTVVKNFFQMLYRPPPEVYTQSNSIPPS